MLGRFKNVQKLEKTTTLIVPIFAFLLVLTACASNVTRTYKGPALSKDEICILAPVVRKADSANKTKGQKVVSFLLAAPNRYHSLYISKIDGVPAYDSPHPYYELPVGQHNLEFKIQRETISYWGKTKSEYQILDFAKTLEMDCKAGQVYAIDFTFEQGNLITKNVTDEPNYKKIFHER